MFRELLEEFEEFRKYASEEELEALSEDILYDKIASEDKMSPTIKGGLIGAQVLGAGNLGANLVGIASKREAFNMLDSAAKARVLKSVGKAALVSSLLGGVAGSAVGHALGKKNIAKEAGIISGAGSKLFKSNLKFNLGNPIGLGLTALPLLAGAAKSDVAKGALIPGYSTFKGIGQEAKGLYQSTKLPGDTFKPKTNISSGGSLDG